MANDPRFAEEDQPVPELLAAPERELQVGGHRNLRRELGEQLVSSVPQGALRPQSGVRGGAVDVDQRRHDVSSRLPRHLLASRTVQQFPPIFTSSYCVNLGWGGPAR